MKHLKIDKTVRSCRECVYKKDDIYCQHPDAKSLQAYCNCAFLLECPLPNIDEDETEKILQKLIGVVLTDYCKANLRCNVNPAVIKINSSVVRDFLHYSENWFAQEKKNETNDHETV